LQEPLKLSPVKNSQNSAKSEIPRILYNPIMNQIEAFEQKDSDDVNSLSKSENLISTSS